MGEDLFAPPHLSAAQKKPILNRGKSFKYKFKINRKHSSCEWDFGRYNNCCTINMSKQYLDITWNSIESLQSWIKLRWTKQWVLAMIVNDNFNKNPDNIIFTIKDTKLFVAIITLSAKDNQKISIFFSKGFGRSVYWKNKKNKKRE